MTKYGLRARVITLTLAPTLIIGLLLSAYFTLNRYHDLENQLVETGASIVEPLAISTEYGMSANSREEVRRLLSYVHRKHSDIIRSIAVFDDDNRLFVTSNFHRNFDLLKFPDNQPIPQSLSISQHQDHLVLRAPILAEARFDQTDNQVTMAVLGYVALELDLAPLRLAQYREISVALSVLLFGLLLSGLFAYRLLKDVSRPVRHMVNVVDQIRRGHLNVRIEGKLLGELDTLKNGINAMAISLSDYHVEMQQSIDQATSDLRETLEQLEIQNVELDIAKKRAQEAARVKSEFLANMSHELRTPLNGVIGFTRQMLKTRLSPSQQDYLQTIEKSANNLLTIINDILDFSKLEAGKLVLETIPFDFYDNLDEVARLLAPSAHDKGLELTLNIDPAIPAGLVGDPLRIQQVLTNLVGNAVKFTERGNIDISVEVKAQHDDGIELQFIVKDSGIGISERQQAELFQAFRQADASISRRYGGTGLGLVITQKLVSEMGGEINMKSRLHKGSTFWFNLRLHKTDLPVSQHLDISQLQGQRILLIEPNRQAAAVLQQQLSFAGLQVTYRSTLPERMVQHDYALLCLSPGPQPPISSLLAQIQHIQMHSKHCVVSLPSTELALSEQLLNSGIDACIGKPLSPRKLYEALLSHRPQQLLSNPAPESETPKLPLRVLAVDDNPANLKLIAALLQERVEQVYRASSGRQALQLAQDHSFDLIFMDIQMPEMDGVTTLKQLRQLKRHGQTPVIAVTAHAMAGERERLLAEGMDDYLTKPIEEAILEQTLIRWGGQMDPATPSLTTLTIEQPTVPAPVRSTKVIDWPLALRQAAGKVDLAREMLSMLIDFVPQVQQEIERALKDLNTADGQALTAIIHKLHGSCAYSGAPRVKALCATLETALKSGQTLPQLEPELSELVDELKNLCKAAPEYLQQHTAQHPH